MQQKTRGFYLKFLGLTIICLLLAWITSSPQGYFTRHVVVPGVLIMAGIQLASYLITAPSASHNNPNRFVRGIMGGTFLKFFLCIVAVGILVWVKKHRLHKPDLVFLMIVYTIYTLDETIMLSKLAKRKPNNPS